MTISTVLLDLDGVVRHFPSGQQARLEQKYGLADGSLQAAAFCDDRLQRLVTGKLSRPDWFALIAVDIGSPEAAAEWQSEIGTIDTQMIAEVRRLRVRGMFVAILTNGADTTRAELHELDVVDEFDAIFNSSEIGLAKPDPRIFRHVCDALRVAPSSVFFTDDTESKLAGAIEIGMTAVPFTSVEAFKADLVRLGIGLEN